MKITLLRFDLRLVQSFAVAAPEAFDGGVNRPAASDPSGRVVVPASSVAGSLRHHAHMRSSERAERLFGPLAEDDAQLSASRLRIVGTSLTLNGKPVTRGDLVIRRQTRIDRRRRAADAQALRSAHVVPAGAKVEVFARLDDDLTDDERETLASWQPVLGWGRNTGQGEAEVEGAWEGVLDLHPAPQPSPGAPGDRREVPSDLARWLLGGGPELHRSVATTPLTTPGPLDRCWRSYRFEVVDALHVAGEPAGGGERANETTLYRRDGDVVIEGSTFKGIVRSRAEYILASMGVDQPEAHDLIATLFGTTGQQGCLAFRSSRVEGAEIEKRPHVAIDRVTGGARDGQLYVLEVAVGGSFELRIDSHGPLPDRAEDLIDAVVRDIHDGLVGIGAHTSSGHGTVALADPQSCPGPPGGRLRGVAS